MKDDIKKEIEFIDNQISYWQFVAKCEKSKLDLALSTINALVEKKKPLVEKCLKLDIVLTISNEK